MNKKNLIIAGIVLGTCTIAWLFWQLVTFILWMCYYCGISM